MSAALRPTQRDRPLVRHPSVFLAHSLSRQGRGNRMCEVRDHPRRGEQRHDSRLLWWFGLLIGLMVWSSPSRAQASLVFRDIRLDALHLDAPIELAPTEDGGVIAVYATGEAMHYDPAGGRRELILPVSPWRPALDPLPRALPSLYFKIAAKPHFRPSSPFTAVFEAMPDVIAWDQRLPNGERIRPWLLRVRLRSRDFLPHEPRWGAREPESGGPGFALKGCRGGSLVVGDGELLFVRWPREDTWTSSSSAVARGYTPDSCWTDSSGSLHIRLDNDEGDEVEVRIDRSGGSDSVRAATLPEPRPMNEGASRERSCVARDRRSGAEFEYAWVESGDVVSVRVRRPRGSWHPLVHLTGPARVACQDGGRGVFLASRQGLDFLDPRPPGAAAPRRQDASTVKALLPRPAPHRPRKPRASWLPDRVHILANYTTRAGVTDRFDLQGDVLVSELEGHLGRGVWSIELSLQWEFGAALDPPTRTSEGRRRLDDLPARMQLSAAVGAPVLPSFGEDLRGRAQKRVHAALRNSLSSAPR